MICDFKEEIMNSTKILITYANVTFRQLNRDNSVIVNLIMQSIALFVFTIATLSMHSFR